MQDGLTQQRWLRGRTNKSIKDRLKFIDTYGNRITRQREGLATTAQSAALINPADALHRKSSSDFAQGSDLYLHQLQLYIATFKGLISENQRAKRTEDETDIKEFIDNGIKFIRSELQGARKIFTGVIRSSSERARARLPHQSSLANAIGLRINSLRADYNNATIGRWWGHGQRAKRFEEISFLERLRGAGADNKVLRQALVTVRLETVESSSGASASCGMFGAHGTLLRLINDILATPTSDADDDVSALCQFCEDNTITIPDYLAKNITAGPTRHSYR